MKIGVFGAGAIGGYVGVGLSAAGEDVVLVSRRWPPGAPALEAVDVRGRVRSARHGIELADAPAALRDADVCLVTVKSKDTIDAARALDAVLSRDCLVVSLQNGLENANELRAHLGGRDVVPGMVGYNVFRDGAARFVQASAGKIMLGEREGDRRLAQLAGALARSGQKLEIRRDASAFLAGKLLLNLNNGVCAATGLGIAASLRDRHARTCFARCLREGERVLRAVGRPPARVAPLGPRTIAQLLSLPDAVVLRLARVLIAVDDRARSSTLQDLERGVPTEIDELNGAIVRLAARATMAAPCNDVIVEAVRELEAARARGERLRFIAPVELLARMDARSS